MTLLRTRLDMPVLAGIRNIPFAAGAATSFTYPNVELREEDRTVGLVLASSELTIRPGFGQTATIAQTITTASAGDGQITADGASGIGALHHDFTAPGGTRHVFEVTATDNLGRVTQLDAGFMVPVTGLEYAYPVVDHVVIAPKTLTIHMGATGQMAAVAADDQGVALTNRVINRTSSNPAVVTVNTDGVLTPIAVGMATIMAESEGVEASMQVTVVASMFGGYTVFDSFNRVDDTASLGTGETGHAWVALDGQWQIADNQAGFFVGGTNNDRTAVVNSGVSDCTISVTVPVYTTADNVRLVFRATDAANQFFLSCNAAAAYDVYKKVAGAFTLLGSGGSAMVSGDVLSVALSGSSIIASVNGVVVVSTTDVFQQTATKHGIGCNTGDNGNRWELFTVSVP